MRLAALTNVADDSRTMLCDGLTTRCANTASSHQGLLGHRGAAVRFLPHPCFLRDAGPASGLRMLCVREQRCEDCKHGHAARTRESNVARKASVATAVRTRDAALQHREHRGKTAEGHRERKWKKRTRRPSVSLDARSRSTERS